MISKEVTFCLVFRKFRNSHHHHTKKTPKEKKKTNTNTKRSFSTSSSSSIYLFYITYYCIIIIIIAFFSFFIRLILQPIPPPLLFIPLVSVLLSRQLSPPLSAVSFSSSVSIFWLTSFSHPIFLTPNSRKHLELAKGARKGLSPPCPPTLLWICPALCRSHLNLDVLPKLFRMT